MKKLLAVFLCLALMIPVFALAEDVEITLWTYPIGSWGNEEVVNGIMVTTAIEAKTTPDIIMEGPERLVANWGAAGKMLDISDLWDDATKADIIAASPAVEAACKNAEGKYYEYPLCMTTHCMVINYNDFEKAGALQFIDEATHTWTTEGFLNALDALNAAGFQPTAVVYCGGQGGDQGTRALVTNLYSGQFTAADHSAYTMNTEENIKALTLLQTLVNEGKLDADPGIVAGDEIALFCNSTISMGFCWNASAAVSNKTSRAAGRHLGLRPVRQRQRGQGGRGQDVHQVRLRRSFPGRCQRVRFRLLPHPRFPGRCVRRHRKG